MTDQQNEALDATGELGFVNPYNFVSTPDRAGDPEGDLGCHAPAGHRRYGEDLLSGRLRISLATRTPLLLCEAEKRPAQGSVPGGTYLGVKTGPDGTSPLLNGSALKGMLRSAYETITNSRFGVFTGHGLPLAMREPIGSRAVTHVGIVVPDTSPAAKTGALRIRVCAPVYIKTSMLKERNVDGAGPVYAKIRKYVSTVRRGNGTTFTVAVWRADDLLPTREAAQAVRCGKDEAVVEAYVFQTGKTFGNKESERLVVMSERSQVGGPWKEEQGTFFKRYLPVDKAREDGWDAVINSYAQAHVDGRFSAQGGTVHGSYITAPETWRGLRLWRMMFVKEMDGGIVLTPAAKGRVPFSHAPEDLLPGSHRPAMALKELSPADRVFGWASQAGKGNTEAAYRGQIRIDTAHGKGRKAKSAVQELSPVFQLATLNGPKEGQARFYTGDMDQRPLDAGADTTPATAFAKDGKKLRGRKVYLTQPELLGDRGGPYFAWNTIAQKALGAGADARYREYIKFQEAGGEPNEKMDVFVESWVRTGTVFTTDLYFTNLNRLELGALLWLMDLPAGAMFHLGRGKPFGFGTVELSYDLNASDIQDHRSLVGRYGGTKAEPGTSFDVVREEFVRAQAEDTGLRRIRDEFLAAAFGVRGVPTHYPRPGREQGPLPGPSAEPYKWWVENSDPRKLGVYLPGLSAQTAPVLPFVLETRPDTNGYRAGRH